MPEGASEPVQALEESKGAELPAWGSLPKVNLGCGLQAPPGWFNIDGSWNARLSQWPFVRRIFSWLGVIPGQVSGVPWRGRIVVRDVRRPLPFRDESVGCVYASHLLEHLYEHEARGLLRECHRVLAPAGVIRIVVPDLRAIVLEYVNRFQFSATADVPEDTLKADRLLSRLQMRERHAVTGSLPYRLYRAATDFHAHKWMYDVESLAGRLTAAGFAEAEARDVHVSRIPGIAEVEVPERILGGEGVCVEAIKPKDVAT